MIITNSVDYVRWTATTALYLDKVANEQAATNYEIYGVLDEVGEVAGMLKREIRDGVKLDHEKFGLELGDIAWYLARLHYNHADLPLDPENDVFPLATEMGLIEKTKGLTCFDIAILICETQKQHFMTAGRAAKFMFGDKPANAVGAIAALHHGLSRKDLTSNFIISMYKRVCQLEEGPTTGILMHIAAEAFSMEAVFDWCALCYRYGYDIIDVLQDNVNKLESRKERGVLHGKGSER